MNGNHLQKLPFLYFLLPYVHLSLMVDFYLHSLAGIIGSVLITAFLGFYARKIRQVPFLITANFINIILTYLIIRIKGLLQIPHTGYSPYLAVTLLLLLFILAQAVGVFWGGFYTSN